MENQFYDQQYLKLCSIADKEGVIQQIIRFKFHHYQSK